MDTVLRRQFYILLAVALTGCSGKLLVYDADQKDVKGMPFRAGEVYVKTGTRDALARGGECNQVMFRETVSLPTGAQYYVNATTGPFAKTAFSLKYNTSGGVSEVSLNSEPAGAENIKATAELVKTLLPLAGVAAAAGRIAPDPSLPACDAGEVDVTLERLGDFIKRNPPR